VGGNLPRGCRLPSRRREAFCFPALSPISRPVTFPCSISGPARGSIVRSNNRKKSENNPCVAATHHAIVAPVSRRRAAGPETKGNNTTNKHTMKQSDVPIVIINPPPGMRAHGWSVGYSPLGVRQSYALFRTRERAMKFARAQLSAPCAQSATGEEIPWDVTVAWKSREAVKAAGVPLV
jgi:hypothetical protein